MQFRTCCPDHKQGELCDGPEANPDNYTMWKNLDPDVKTYSVHLQPSYSPTEHHRLEYLYQSKCSQQFDLTRSGSEVLLKMRKTGNVYQPHEFCVNFQSDGTLAAIVANRLEDQSEETNITVKSELDEQFDCLQTSMVEVTAKLMKLTDMREGGFNGLRILHILAHSYAFWRILTHSYKKLIFETHSWRILAYDPLESIF